MQPFTRRYSKYLVIYALRFFTFEEIKKKKKKKKKEKKEERFGREILNEDADDDATWSTCDEDF